MAKSNFQFSNEVPTLEFLMGYYHKAKDAINFRYSEENPKFISLFLGRKPKEIDNEKEELLKELSTDVSFAILAYIESRFRTDFIVRRRNRKRSDLLAGLFHANFKMSKEFYSYPLVTGIFKDWKETYAENDVLLNLFNQLGQAFDYRNWVAHGRYWVFKDNPNKYTYNYTLGLAQNVDALLGAELKSKELFKKK